MVRIGIIGAGRFAERHLVALDRLNDRVCVTHIARRRTEEPFPAAAERDIPVVPLEDLLASTDVDAVCVCSPNDRHRPHTEAALRAGKHVFCEKPLALSVADVDAVVATAQKANRVLMTGHLTRHSTLYQTVAEIVDSGRLGELQIVHASRLQVARERSWRMDPNAGGGAPFDLLIHDFDVLNWFLGKPERIVAQGRRHGQGAYAYLAATLTYPTGAVTTVEGGFVLRPGAPFRATMRLIGDRGHLELDTADSSYPIHVANENCPVEKLPAPAGDPPFDGIAAEWLEFLEAIDGHPPTRLRLEDARLAVHCAELAVHSADQSVPLSFGLPPPSLLRLPLPRTVR